MDLPMDETFGFVAAAPAAQPPRSERGRYDAERGLLGTLRRLDAYGAAQVLGSVDTPMLVVWPSEDRVLLLASPDKIEAQLLHNEQALQMRPLRAGGQLPGGQGSMSLTALKWQLALIGCKGRPLAGLELDDRLQLAHWPNLTRLAAIPHAIRLSALLCRTPLSLRMTLRLLGVPPVHVFDFLAASHAIGLLSWQAASTAASPVVEVATPVPAEQQRGLLRRLLGKVLGL